MKVESKIRVTVSRLWNNPKIETTLSKDGIFLVMELDDFKEALKLELNLNEEINVAFEKIITGIKMESSKVV